MKETEIAAPTPSDYAAGRAEIPADAKPIRFVAAQRLYTFRGSLREHWFRMVFRDGEWSYFAEERLPNSGYRAADRKVMVHGDLFVGELVAQHDRGGPVDGVGLIVRDDEGKAHIEWLDFHRRRDGRLAVTLPDGSEVLVPNPRK